MEQRPLGPSGLTVSAFALGTLTFGREADEATSRSILDAYLDAGGSFVDTADMYGRGRSEGILGRALTGRRDRLALATKLRFGDSRETAGLSRAAVVGGVDRALARLRTDRVDLLQLHAWDPSTPVEETFAALAEVVATGKVRFVGVSNYTGWQLAHVVTMCWREAWPAPVSLQASYSLLARDVERDLVPLCLATSVAVLPWSPLAGGVLTGKYDTATPSGSRATGSTGTAATVRELLVARTGRVGETLRAVARETGRTPGQVALRWLLDRPGVTAPVLGARTVAQLTENLGALGWQLDDSLRMALDDASRIDLGYPHDVDGLPPRPNAPLRTPWRERGERDPRVRQPEHPPRPHGPRSQAGG